MSSISIKRGNFPKIALVGCGAVAEKFYLPALARNSALAPCLFLVDINRDRVKAMASKFGIRAYLQDYHDVLSEIDGAIVALPHHLHYEVVMDFLSAGVHVLCEKPLAETFEQANSMVQEAKRRSVYLCVNYTRRLFPSFKKVKELLDEGVIGELVGFHLEEGGEFNWPTYSGFYFDSKVSNHGVLMDRGPHVIDLVCWWFDSRPKVKTYIDDSFGGCEAVALLDFLIKGAIPGYIKLSWLSRLKNTCVIRGEEGTIICEVHNWREIRVVNNRRSIKICPPAPQRYFSDFGVEVINNFIRVIQGREMPIVSGEDVLDSVSVIEKCYRKRKSFSLPWLEVG